MTTGSVPLYSAPLLYSQQRALETVQALEDFSPVRIFSVLFPLWEVEIIGTQRRSRHYELVEHIVSRSIAQGQLCSTTEIATFLGMTERHVEKALVFLRQVGHLRGSDGSLALTQLGRESLAAGVSYRELETRRKLYFDAFWSHPLPRSIIGSICCPKLRR